jgi:hypothetical protein
LKITFFDLVIWIKIVSIVSNFFANQDIFLLNFFKPVEHRKEPELQFVISVPALGDNLILALWVSAPAPQYVLVSITASSDTVEFEAVLNKVPSTIKKPQKSHFK